MAESIPEKIESADKNRIQYECPGSIILIMKNYADIVNCFDIIFPRNSTFAYLERVASDKDNFISLVIESFQL